MGVWWKRRISWTTGTDDEAEYKMPTIANAARIVYRSDLWGGGFGLG